jgi:sulfhydrogenase subunit beta (sulfur reductase)
MIIKKSDIPALLEALADGQQVLVPGVEDGISRFVAYGPGVVPRFDLQLTKEPPKESFFPRTEKMLRWKRHEGALSFEQAQVANEPFVLFGVRPCDMASVDRLDQVFLTKGYVDTFYQARRNAATIVAMTCTSVAETCFCDSISASPNQAPTADIVLRDAGDVYTVAAQTEKGTTALETWKPLLADGDPQVEDVSCTLKVSMDGVPEKLHRMYDDPLWEEVANTCLTCGTCTFFCPTCFCFDISQDRRADEGNRFRCWDSCMFTDYTLMAGNHNPRAKKDARVRQRFMHKLSFFHDRYGENLCVGCGRCIIDCPAGVDISSIIDKIGAAHV